MENSNQTPNITPPLVQAVISHFVAKRDRALAELDMCFNKTTNSENITDKICALFMELADADKTLETIEKTIKPKLNTPEVLNENTDKQ